ncbi:MAG: histidine kinase [Anaerolineae bacterium]|nr:histidine kinase [Thermoflexales bacterium]MDW8408825.1 histidine kinase [Anaerolineae bacterium]
MPFHRLPRLFILIESSLVRVSVAVLLVLVGYAVLFIFFARGYADRTIELRRQEVKRLAHIVLNALEPALQQQRSGQISPDQARTLAREMIWRMIYADEAGSTVLLGSDAGEVWALSTAPSGSGANLFDPSTGSGVDIVRQFMRVAAGAGSEGYVEYDVPAPVNNTSQREIFYVIRIPEWNGYLAAGMSLDDVELRTQSYFQNALVLTLGLAVLIFVAIFMTLLPTARSYTTLLRLFEHVSRNPDDLPDVPVDQFSSGTEGWRLLTGFQTMLERIRFNREKLQESERQLERRVAERTRELSNLLQVSRDVASTLELEPLLGLILDRLKSVVDYTSCAIFTLEEGQLVCLDYRGPAPRERMLDFCPSKPSAAEEVLRLRAPVIISDVRGNHRLARAFRDSVGPYMDSLFAHVQCWMGVPLIVQERPIGLLSLDSSQAGYYTAQHASLALAIANQAAIAIENARLYQQSQQLAALQERQRLARELHDSVSQALYGIALGARTVRRLLDATPERPADSWKDKLTQPLDYVLQLAEAGLAEMRALIFELRPESLQNEGLVAALSKQSASTQARYGIVVETDLCDEPPLPFEYKEALYRLTQEALHNIVKHAKASRVHLRLTMDEHSIWLEIQDNGIGFDVESDFPGHLGLKSMRERVEKIGGTLTIASAPGQGTTITARVNVPRRPSRTEARPAGQS